MAPPIDLRDQTGPTPSRGPAFLYVAPCAYEDLLKLGFSRDPLQRLQSMHARFFEFFDLGRAMLVATETVRDARMLELALRRRLAEHNAPAPLTARPEAGGASEWYRGAYDILEQAVDALCESGHAVHAPAEPWFRTALQARAPFLYAWTDAALTSDERDGRAGATPVQMLVRDALDAYTALRIDLAPWLPPAVLRWYMASGG